MLEGQLPKMAVMGRECGERAKVPERSHTESTGLAKRLKVSTEREAGMEN